MKHILFSLTVGMLVHSAAQAGEFKVRCRKAIHGSFHVDEFDDWKIVANDMISELDGVSIFKRGPEVPAAAVPDDFTNKGVKFGTLKLEGGENWLVCHHSKMKMVIQQKLPAGLKSCTLSDGPDAVSVVCR
jgi:hypothetical protein